MEVILFFFQDHLHVKYFVSLAEFTSWFLFEVTVQKKL